MLEEGKTNNPETGPARSQRISGLLLVVHPRKEIGTKRIFYHLAPRNPCNWHSSALFVWTCLADKPWLKVLLADLV